VSHVRVLSKTGFSQNFAFSNVRGQASILGMTVGAPVVGFDEDGAIEGRTLGKLVDGRFDGVGVGDDDGAPEDGA